MVSREGTASAVPKTPRKRWALAPEETLRVSRDPFMRRVLVAETEFICGIRSCRLNREAPRGAPRQCVSRECLHANKYLQPKVQAARRLQYQRQATACP